MERTHEPGEGSDALGITEDDIAYVTEHKKFDDNEISKVIEKIIDNSKRSIDSSNKDTGIEIKKTEQENTQNLVQTDNQNFYMQEEMNKQTKIKEHKPDIDSGDVCIFQTNLRSDFVSSTCNTMSKKEANFEKYIESDHKESKDVNDLYDQDVYKRMRIDLSDLTCNICERMFQSRFYLEIHYRDIHKYLFCDQCVYQTQDKSDFDKHSMTHVDVFDFECNNCNKKFEARFTSHTHYKYIYIENQSRKIFSCDQCSYLSKNKLNLSIHKRMHVDIPNFVCIICGGKFKNSFYLDKHYSNIHKQQYSHMLAYDQYMNWINSTTDLTKRKKTYDRELSSFECKACKISFQDHSFLKHVKLHHMWNINNIQCNDCLRDLRRDLQQDKAPKYFLQLCDICKQYFETEMSFKIHNEEKHPRVFCNICFKQFPTIVRLQKHAITHDTRSLNICPICYEIFKTKKCLHFHMEKHTNKIHNRTNSTKADNHDSNLPVNLPEA